jgi:ParB family transcriptional regulator, chromosome partitioning protein
MAKKEKPKSGDVLFVALNKLKKSPRNVRKTPHTKAEIEALAASIAANGLLQNLIIEPEHDKKGRATGYYLVTAGEGRRLAQLLRAKRKEITKTEPIRCVVDTEHSAEEVSLAENTIRSDMHPADQYEAFAKLHDEQGMPAEDIAARFGVTPAVVRQRLKLAAVSPKLIQLYRDGQMSLEELTAFTVTDDHAKQERVWAELPDFRRSREGILHLLRQGEVSTADRRALFVGVDVYEEEGGEVARDLFDEKGRGSLTDAELLNRLVREKLQIIAQEVLSEGWRWVSVEPEYDYQLTAGMRRLHPIIRELTPEEQATVDELEAEYDALFEQESALQEGGEPTGEIADRLQAIAAQIIGITGGERYHTEDKATAGAIVSLGHNGAARIERGFIRKEDDRDPEGRPANGEKEEGGEGDPGPGSLSERLVAELTAHRTAALRNELAQRPETVLIALTHTLAAASFYLSTEGVSCLQITPCSATLSVHASGIDETPALRAIAERHEHWQGRLPARVRNEEPDRLWTFIAELDPAERLSLLAHCVALTVNAVRTPNAMPAAEDLAEALALDMTRYWQPTVANYFSRVSKERILEAVREGVSEQAALEIASFKKQPMAEAAERLLAGKGWLPALLRSRTASGGEG